MGYLLRKWYFDFLTAEREYVFVYFAYLQLMGKVQRSLTVHCARPGGIRLTRSIAIPFHQETSAGGSPLTIRIPEGEIIVSAEECSIRFSHGDCKVQLHFTQGGRFHCTPVQIGRRSGSHIHWSPVGMKYQVSGSVALGSEVIEAKGVDGYADFLESTYLPPVVPVRTLYWGRIHHRDIDLVYSHSSSARERHVWSNIYVRTVDGLREYGPATIIRSAPSVDEDAFHPGLYEVRGSDRGEELRVKICHDATVQRDSFIDQQDISSRSLRSMLKLLTRNPRSTKYLSHAEITLEGPVRPLSLCGVPLINEIALL